MEVVSNEQDRKFPYAGQRYTRSSGHQNIELLIDMARKYNITSWMLDFLTRDSDIRDSGKAQISLFRVRRSCKRLIIKAIYV
jgi:hypothetical protein